MPQKYLISAVIVATVIAVLTLQWAAVRWLPRTTSAEAVFSSLEVITVDKSVEDFKNSPEFIGALGESKLFALPAGAEVVSAFARIAEPFAATTNSQPSVSLFARSLGDGHECLLGLPDLGSATPIPQRLEGGIFCDPSAAVELIIRRTTDAESFIAATQGAMNIFISYIIHQMKP